MENMKMCWLLMSILLAYSEGAKIMVWFPLPSKSHGILGDGVVRHLLNAGHEVSYVTPFEYKNPPANLRVLDVSSNFELMPKDMLKIKNVMDKKENNDMQFSLIINMMSGILNHTVTNKDVQKVLNDPKEQFDAVIIEWIFSEAPAGLAQVFECPLIWVSSLEAHWIILRLIDEPSNPAYTTDIMSSYSPPLSFTQRVAQLWNQLFLQAMNYLWLDGVQESTYVSLFKPIVEKRGRKLVGFDEARFNASLMLTNAYVSTSVAVSLPQSHKYIGGYHIDDTVKPLPENLKKIMDNAKNGVIYFSMGSNWKSKDMPEEIKTNLLKMFGSLKQTVLWKFEEVLPNLPPNVHILEWAPQQAILSHSNVVAFITHGGLLSTLETIHFGKPIIGIPVFGDQHTNIEKAVNKGFALKVDLSYSMVEELKKAIAEITTNPQYAEKVKQLSFIHHDRPVKPGQELVHWVNHVINTRGAPHLRSPAVDLPFYKRKFLDLAALIAVSLLIIYVLLKRACTYVCSKTKKRTGSEKKNN